MPHIPSPFQLRHKSDAIERTPKQFETLTQLCYYYSISILLLARPLIKKISRQAGAHEQMRKHCEGINKQCMQTQALLK